MRETEREVTDKQQHRNKKSERQRQTERRIIEWPARWILDVYSGG